MQERSEVLDSAKFIASKATEVTVSADGVLKAAKLVSGANNLSSISTKSLISHQAWWDPTEGFIFLAFVLEEPPT